MESVTGIGWQWVGIGWVLNAFRHHGIGHLIRYGGLAVPFGCSTPSGIMESVTRGPRA